MHVLVTLLLALAAMNAAAERPLDKFRKAIAENKAYVGVWEGTFRRYDAAGNLTAEFPSHIEARFDPTLETPYSQTNTYNFADGTVQEINSRGQWDDGQLIFVNERIDGRSADLTPEQDPDGRSSMLSLKFKDGSGMYMYEIITVSDDGKSRSRMAQYLIDGKVVRRTLIDETKTAERWEEREP